MTTRVLIARHGEATYDHPELISDEGGRLTEHGRAQAARLGLQVRPEDCVAVVTSTMSRAVETGTIAAGELGLEVTSVDGLREFGVGDYAGKPDGEPGLRAIYQAWFDGRLDTPVPGAQSGTRIVARFGAAVGAVAAAHPDQSVLVVSHGGIMSIAIPTLCHNVPDSMRRRPVLANCCVIRVDVDGDDWSMHGDWPGTALGEST